VPNNKYLFGFVTENGILITKPTRKPLNKNKNMSVEYRNLNII
jgi:hypothetical protein